MGAIGKGSLIYFWPAGLGISILFAHKPGWVFLFLKPYVFLRKEIYHGILIINRIQFWQFDRMLPKSPKPPKLRASVGAVVSVISKFVHPSRSIFHKYPNRTKNHKLEGFILVEVDAKVVRRGADTIMFFVFTHFDFPDEQFYAAKIYIHVTQECEDDSLFVLSEAVTPAVSSGAIGPLTFDKTNRADGAEAKKCPYVTIGPYV